MRNKRILLHVCCAPDATTAFLRLREKFADVVFYFYNPNVHPREEYDRRLEAAKKLASAWEVELIEGEYEPQAYFEAVKGYEHLGEGSIRCFYCIKHRLFKTAEMAKRLGFDVFSTSLTTSPKKDYDMVFRAGREASNAFGIEFYIEDFKKEGGYPLSVKLSKELGLYRQNYCGCVFSLKEAMQKREESRKKRLSEIEKLREMLGLKESFPIDPEEYELSAELLEKIGFESYGRLISLIRPRLLIVEKSLYEKLFSGKKNARFGKFKVRIKVLERTFV